MVVVNLNHRLQMHVKFLVSFMISCTPPHQLFATPLSSCYLFLPVQLPVIWACCEPFKMGEHHIWTHEALS